MYQEKFNENPGVSQFEKQPDSDTLTTGLGNVAVATAAGAISGGASATVVGPLGTAAGALGGGAMALGTAA